LLSGQRILARGVINEVQTPRFVGNGKVYHGHAFLIDYFRLRYLLKLSGFDRIEVFTDRFSPSSIALAPKEIADHVFSAALLFGKRLIVVATKAPATTPARG